MTAETVEAVRRMYESWNRDAEEEMDAFIHPEYEYHPSGAFPGFDAVYKGREGFAKFRREMLEAWDYLELEPTAIEEHGEWLLVELSFHGRGRGSGATGTSRSRPAPARRRCPGRGTPPSPGTTGRRS